MAEDSKIEGLTICGKVGGEVTRKGGRTTGNRPHIKRGY